MTEGPGTEGCRTIPLGKVSLQEVASQREGSYKIKLGGLG